MTDWKEKYKEFQVLQKHIEQVTEHVQQLHEQKAQLEITQSAIQEIEKTPENNEILAPVAQGIFIKAKLADPKNLILHVGSKTTVEKTVGQVSDLLKEQEEHATKRLIESEALLNELNQKMMLLYEELEENVQQA